MELTLLIKIGRWLIMAQNPFVGRFGVKSLVDLEVEGISTLKGNVGMEGELTVDNGITSSGEVLIETSNVGAYTVNTDRDDLVIENVGAGGISIVTGGTTTGNIWMGNQSNLIQSGWTSSPTITSFGAFGSGSQINFYSDGNHNMTLGDGGSLDIVGDYSINGDNINTAGVLDNVGYLNQANTFTQAMKVDVGSAHQLTIAGVSAEAGDSPVGSMDFVNRRSSATTVKARIESRTGTTVNTAGLHFHTSADGNTATEKMTLSDTGKLTNTGSINTINGSYQMNGLDINAAGTLSNVAYLDQANTFTEDQTFSKRLMLPILSSVIGNTNIIPPADNSLVLYYSNATNWSGLTADKDGRIVITQGRNSADSSEIVFKTYGNASTYSMLIDYYGNCDIAGAYKIGDADINTAGTLSNVAYLNQANTFTANQTVNGSIIAGVEGTENVLTGYTTVYRNLTTTNRIFGVKNGDNNYALDVMADGEVSMFGNLSVGGSTSVGDFELDDIDLFSLSRKVAGNALMDIYSFDGDGTDNNGLRVYGVGTKDDHVNNEIMYIGSDSARNDHRILSLASGTGVVRPIHIYTEGNEDQMLINANGTIELGGDLTSSQDILINDTSTSGASNVYFKYTKPDFSSGSQSSKILDGRTTSGFGSTLGIETTVTGRYFNYIDFKGSISDKSDGLKFRHDGVEVANIGNTGDLSVAGGITSDGESLFGEGQQAITNKGSFNIRGADGTSGTPSTKVGLTVYDGSYNDGNLIEARNSTGSVKRFVVDDKGCTSVIINDANIPTAFKAINEANRLDQRGVAFDFYTPKISGDGGNLGVRLLAKNDGNLVTDPDEFAIAINNGTTVAEVLTVKGNGDLSVSGSVLRGNAGRNYYGTSDENSISYLVDFGSVSTGYVQTRMYRVTNTNNTEARFTIYKADGTSTEALDFNAKNGYLKLLGSTPVVNILSTRNGDWSAGDVMSSINFDSEDTSGTGDLNRCYLRLKTGNEYGTANYLSFGVSEDGTGKSAIERMSLNYEGKLTVSGRISTPKLNISDVPTSASGLSSGDIWSDGGTLKIVS